MNTTAADTLGGSAQRPESTGGRPVWYEVADAIWLACQQAAAGRRADQGEGEETSSGEPPPRQGAEDPTGVTPPAGGTGPPGDRGRGAVPPAGSAAWDLERDIDVPAGPSVPGSPNGAGDRRGPQSPPSAIEPVMPRGGTGFPGFTMPPSPAPQLHEDPFTGVPPLLRRRRLSHSLRPFKRSVESRTGDPELDEDATARRAAEDGLWLPQCRRAREHWLDLDIVVDDSRFATLHRRTAEQFIDSVATVGAFGLIRLHLLDTDVSQARALTLRGTGPSSRRLPATALPGLGRPDRRLVLMLTDGVGDAWHAMAAQEALAQWASHFPVAIVQLLPRRQWRRTGIATHAARLRAPGPALANLHYQAWPAGGATAPVRRPSHGGVHVPVVEMDPEPLAAWARFATAGAPGWRGPVTLCGAGPGDDVEPVMPSGGFDADDGPPPPGDAAETVRRFRAAATPTVFALAVHLAAVPLNIPVMRLVQRTMLPDSRPADLSELVGSGLLRRVGPGDGHDGDTLDTVTYDFFPGIRAELLAAGRRSETTRVLMTVTEHLGERVGVLRALRDLVVSPGQAGVPAMTAEAVPFAEPMVHAFRALAGPYARPALALHSSVASAAMPPSLPTGPGNVAARLNLHGGLTEEPPAPTLDVGTTHDMSPINDQTMADDRDATEYPISTYKTPIPGVGVTIRTIPPAAERSPAEPPPVWGNVPPRNINFTGRTDLLEALHQRLSEGTTAVLPQALHGMGGVGKSQIAIEYVYRNMQSYDLVWWISAERPGQIQQGLAELAAQLGLPVSREVNVAVPAVREALRLGRPYRNWLLVFDNAEQLDEVREFFPTNGPGKILVTSRNQAWNSVARSLEVDVFAREESMALLRLRGPELDEADTNELAHLLGDLPLAIEQAAVWLAETGMPVAEYLHLFREKHDQAAELLHDAAPIAYELPVAAAWNVSLDQLRQSEPGALQLLQVCAFFAPEPISRRLLTGGRNVAGPPELVEVLSDPVKLGRAVRSINQYALAKISHRHNTIMLHRLVQRVLIGQMTPQEAAELRHCGHQLLAAADPNAPDLSMHWQQYADLLPHVLHSDIVDCDDPWARQLVLNEIDFLFQWGDHQGFLELAQKAVDTWTAALGENHEQTLAAGLHLGRALRLNGRFKEAYERHVAVRDRLISTVGEEDERTLEAQLYVGADQRYLGEFIKALELDRDSFEIVQRRFGRDDPTTLHQAHLYAIDLRLIGEAERALELDRDTYQRLVTLFGEDHKRTLGSLASIAVDEMECGRFAEARDLMRQHTQRVETAYDPSYPGLAEGLTLLSVMERKAGDHNRALELSSRAVALFRTHYGDRHLGSVAAAINHAVNLRQVNRLPESITLTEETAKRYEAMFGPRHPNTPTAHINLAVALRLAGRTEEARRLNEAALASLIEVLGPDHPRSIVCSINLASDLFALGDQRGALELDERSLERVRRVLGEDHPTALACGLNHALDLRAIGEEAEAETRFTETLGRLRRVLGDGHPATISAQQSIRADCDIYPIPV